MALHLTRSDGQKDEDYYLEDVESTHDEEGVVFSRRIFLDNNEDCFLVVQDSEEASKILSLQPQTEEPSDKSVTVLFGSIEHCNALSHRIEDLKRFLTEHEEENRIFNDVQRELSSFKRQLAALQSSKDGIKSSFDDMQLQGNGPIKRASSPYQRLESIYQSRVASSKGSMSLFIPQNNENDFKSAVADANSSPTHHVQDEFGRLQNVKFIKHNFERSFFNIPRLKQYFEGDIFYREKSHSRVTWDELFFDLLFVLNFANVGAKLEDDRSILSLLEYINVFYPIWMVWFLTTLFLNRVVLDDLSAKIFLLLNAGAALVMTLTSKLVFPQHEQNDTAVVLTRANMFITAFLASRLMYSLMLTLTLRNSPKFMIDIISECIFLIISSVVYIISIAVADDNNRLVFWSVALGIDLLYHLVSPIIKRHVFKSKYRLALNIEHFTERVGLLTIIAIGEMILLLKPKNPQIFVVEKYYASFLGLVNAACLQWIYFDVDASIQFVHAIRRGPTYGNFWKIFHFPLHAALAIGATGLDFLIENLGKGSLSAFEKLIYPTSLFSALLLTAIIAAFHYSPSSGRGVYSKNIRLICRALTAVFILSLNIAFVSIDLSLIASLGFTTLLVFLQSVLEQYLKEKGRLREQQQQIQVTVSTPRDQEMHPIHKD